MFGPAPTTQQIDVGVTLSNGMMKYQKTIKILNIKKTEVMKIT